MVVVCQQAAWTLQAIFISYLCMERSCSADKEDNETI
jgi:hypothetical protein